MSHAANRVLWTVVGLLFTVLGAAAFVASLGYLPGTDSHATLIWSGLTGLWRDISPWGPIVTIALGLLVALGGWSLLRRQLRWRPGPALDEYDLRDLPGTAPGNTPDRPGVTRVQGAALADGLERDLTRDPQIRRASVLLTGPPPEPELRIRLQVTPQAPLSTLREHVHAAVDRFVATSGLRPRRLDVTTRVDPSGGARVR